MASKRGSMMLPSDFSLEDFAMTPPEQTKDTDPADHNDMGEQQPPGEQELRTDSRYYSLVSDRTSMRTFYTSRSSFASSMRDSVASHRQVPRNARTPWQKTLHEMNLILLGFDETDWSGRGQHAEFGPEEDSTVNDILRPDVILGHSATAIVERVRCKRILLARKKIKCNWRLKREQAIEEVACLQRLNHAHVVRCIGTYIQGRELSILLYPATSHNLETFLDRYTDLSNISALLPIEHEERLQMRQGLSRFFDCLTSTVLFIHNQLIKHMDIKPSNILVEAKHGLPQVYIADFGIARAYSNANEAETDSRTSFSRTFAAPEVVRQDTRGFAADIFSLGCVFLEILAAGTGFKNAIDTLRMRNLSGDFSYQGNLEVIKSCSMLQDYVCPYASTPLCQCVRWQRQDSFLRIHGSTEMTGRSSGRPSMDCGVNWGNLKSTIRDMCDDDPGRRPTAQNLQDRLQAQNKCCSLGAEPLRAELPLGARRRMYEGIAE